MGLRVVVLRVSGLSAVTFGLSNLLLLRGKVGQIFWLKVTTFCHPLGQQFAEGWGASSVIKNSFHFEDSEGTGG